MADKDKDIFPKADAEYASAPPASAKTVESVESIVPEPEPAAAAAKPSPAAELDAPEPVASAKPRTAVAGLSAMPVAFKEAVTGIQSKLSGANTWFAQYGTLLVSFVIAAAVCVILGYILYVYLASKLQNRESYLLTETNVPVPGLQYSVANGGAIPATANGRRRSITFWVYIHDLARFTGTYRHVFHVGEKNLKNASPVVFMDKSSNKMYVRFTNTTVADEGFTMHTPFNAKPFATGGAGLKPAAASATAEDKLAYDIATHGVVIDYVPLQRWVHIAIVVNENVNNGSITVFVDGELVKVDVGGEVIAPATTASVKRVYTDMELDRRGDVWIGGAPYEEVGPGFSGFVSRIAFFNYDLNTADIYAIYAQGPVDNLTSKLGLPAYGVRSPIYRIGSD